MRMFTPSQTLRAGRREAHPSLRTSCLHSLYTFYVVPLAAVFRYSEVLIYDRFSRWAAEAKYDLRLDRLDLALQVGVASPDLTRFWLPILHSAALFDGGAALHEVGQIDLLAGQFHGRQDVVEKLARPPDERESCGVLVLAGSLADEH